MLLAMGMYNDWPQAWRTFPLVWNIHLAPLHLTGKCRFGLWLLAGHGWVRGATPAQATLRRFCARDALTCPQVQVLGSQQVVIDLVTYSRTHADAKRSAPPKRESAGFSVTPVKDIS